MIKIFKINKHYELFNDKFSEVYLASKGIEFTSNVVFADIFLASSTKGRRTKIAKLFFFKKLLIWTNEPRYDSTFSHFEKKREIIMNVYSKNVFLNNLHFLGSYHYDFSNDLGIALTNPLNTFGSKLNFKNKKFCAAVFAYKNPNTSSLFFQGEDLSLNKLRQDLALFMYNKKKADIIGSGWPKHVKITEESGFESGGTEWWIRKIEILKNYKYNICFENTAYPHYCTEKIWHAIVSGCLPIYYGKGTAIYETFSEDSFIDASKFKSLEELLYFLENLSESAFLLRHKKCLEILQKSCKEKLDNVNMKTEIIDNFILSVYKLVN